MIIKKHQIEATIPRLPEIGRLFKGSPKQHSPTAKNPDRLIAGRDLDHFRFEPADSTKALPAPDGSSTLYEYLRQQWDDQAAAFGDYRSIPVLLPYGAIAENYSYGNRVYGAGGNCVRSCDGEICDRHQEEFFDKKANKTVKRVVRSPIPCAMQPDDTECPAGCKGEAKLKLLIPALGIPGTILLTTHSGRDISTLLANLKAFERFDLSAIPFRLCRTLEKCDRQGENGEIIPGQKWFCQLRVDPQYGLLALERQQQRKLAELTGAAMPALPSAAPKLPALPVYSDYTNQTEWIQFLGELSGAIRSGDRTRANDVCTVARGMVERGVFPPHASGGIDREFNRAMEAIATAGHPVSVQVSTARPKQPEPQPAPDLTKRIAALCSLLKCQPTDLEAIAVSKTGRSLLELSSSDFRKVRSLAFLDWATIARGDRGLPAINVASEWTRMAEELGDLSGLSDAELFQRWGDRILSV
jgi:hypothetical protein